MNQAIQIKNLVKTYATGTKALKGVDLQVEKGDFFALLGANGAGKTTIISILTGLTNKTSGQARIFNHDLDTAMNAAKLEVGLVPQEFNFNIFETVLEIVVTQAGYYGVPRAEGLIRAEKILKDLSLWEKRHDVARTLSGGMKRRLMIARSLMHHPKLLFLDEPTAGVDVELRYGMWEYLSNLNKQGVTIFLTTHYLEEAEQLCRNVAIIKDGLIVKQGTTKALLSSLEKQTYVLNVRKVSVQTTTISKYGLRVIDETTIEADLNTEDNLTTFIGELAQMDIIVKDIRPKGNRLEQLFLDVLKA